MVVDSTRPEAIAGWWADRFGVEADTDGEDWGIDKVPGMPFENLVFVPVPEPKTVKNRLHWDVRGDVAELERAGAQGAGGEVALGGHGRPRGQRVLRLPARLIDYGAWCSI